MKRPHAIAALGLVSALQTLLPAHAEDSAERHLLVDAEVTVDAEGTVSAVTLLGQTLPALIQGRLAEDIHALRFEPIRVDGAPATVTTPMRFSACVRAETEQLKVALDLLTIGPRQATASAPPITREMIQSARKDHEYLFKLNILVNPDGAAVLEGFAVDGFGERQTRQFERDYRRWVEQQPFIPERVNGEPVATRIEWPVTFWISDPSTRPTSAAAQASCARARETAANNEPRWIAGPVALRLRSQS